MAGMTSPLSEEKRLVEDGNRFDFTVSDVDMAELDSLDRTGGTERAVEQLWW